MGIQIAFELFDLPMEVSLLSSAEDFPSQKDCFIKMTVIICVLLKHIPFVVTLAGFWIGIYTIISEFSIPRLRVKPAAIPSP